jgi:Family of unknown function (DUF6069)
MSTTATTTLPAGSISAGSTTRSHPVLRATFAAGAVAAALTTAIAAGADAAGVQLAIEGEAIPLAGFAQMTLLGAVLGGLIAAALNRFGARPRRWFVAVAVALTALSCIPSVALPSDVATSVTLVVTHVVAALVIVPAIARRIRA